jgi:hypothetical protein
MNESTAIRAALDVRSRASSARVIRASARSLLERGLLGRSRSRSRGARDAIYDLEAADRPTDLSRGWKRTTREISPAASASVSTPTASSIRVFFFQFFHVQ